MPYISKEVGIDHCSLQSCPVHRNSPNGLVFSCLCPIAEENTDDLSIHEDCPMVSILRKGVLQSDLHRNAFRRAIFYRDHGELVVADTNQSAAVLVIGEM